MNAPDIDPSAVFAAGMLDSTAHDLLRWATLRREGRVSRDPASARTMFTPHVDTGLPLGGYGFGVFVGTHATPALYAVWPTSDRQQDVSRSAESYRLAADSVHGIL